MISYLYKIYLLGLNECFSGKIEERFKYYLVLLGLMESITIKVDESMARSIEKAMKPHYATKTEFIREAIREKIENRSDLMRQLVAGLQDIKEERIKRVI